MRKTAREEPLMTIFTTPTEAVAVGDVIVQYLSYVHRLPQPTQTQKAQAELLASFQQRLVQTASGPAAQGSEVRG